MLSLGYALLMSPSGASRRLLLFGCLGVVSFDCPNLVATLSSNFIVSLLRFVLGIGVPRDGVIAVLDSTPKVSMAVTKVS